MTDGFAVDLEVLGDAGRGISRILDQLRECDVDDLDGPSARYGHDGLHDAFEHFCGRWQYGLELLTEDGATIAHGLARTIQSYRRPTDGHAPTRCIGTRSTALK